MTLEQILAFGVFSLVAAVTPGPSNTLLTSVGAQVGIQRGLPCLLGISAGMGTLLFAVALGVTSALLGHPEVMRVIKFGGAAFLLWLAWRIATSGGGETESSGASAGFVAGAALQWVNPKAWIIGAGAATTYLEPDPSSVVVQALTLVAVFMLAALPAGFVWLAFGASMRGFLRDARRRRIFNIAMGLALALSVATILR